MLLSSLDLGARALLSSKLLGARFPLYQSQILQENTRWKALAEIYTMHSFAPFSWDPSLSSTYCLKIAKMFAKCLPNFAKFVKIPLDVGQRLPEFCRNSKSRRIEKLEQKLERKKLES